MSEKIQQFETMEAFVKELGLHDQLPNIHLIRHVAQQLGVELT